MQIQPCKCKRNILFKHANEYTPLLIDLLTSYLSHHYQLFFKLLTAQLLQEMVSVDSFLLAVGVGVAVMVVGVVALLAKAAYDGIITHAVWLRIWLGVWWAGNGDQLELAHFVILWTFIKNFFFKIVAAWNRFDNDAKLAEIIWNHAVKWIFDELKRKLAPAAQNA